MTGRVKSDSAYHERKRQGTAEKCKNRLHRKYRLATNDASTERARHMTDIINVPP